MHHLQLHICQLHCWPPGISAETLSNTLFCKRQKISISQFASFVCINLWTKSWLPLHLSLSSAQCARSETFQEEERMHSSISLVEMRNYHSVRFCRAADNWTFSRSLSISVHSLFCICYNYQQHKVLYTSHHTVIHPIHPIYSTTMLHPSEMTFLMHTYLYVNLNM